MKATQKPVSGKNRTILFLQPSNALKTQYLPVVLSEGNLKNIM